ncbi:MAG: hypothetical protein ACI4UO_06960 [Paludibacteraceae bacterium]
MSQRWYRQCFRTAAGNLPCRRRKGAGSGVSPRDHYAKGEKESRQSPQDLSAVMGTCPRKPSPFCGAWLVVVGYSSSQSGQVLSAVVGSSVRLQPQCW